MNRPGKHTKERTWVDDRHVESRLGKDVAQKAFRRLAHRVKANVQRGQHLATKGS